jgi:DNA-binding FadR family transcriptional regulator
MDNFINKKSLADEVASRLQEQISLGHYKINEKLPIEPELMKSFGVGRSTIREAIKILANSGLLRVQQGVGTFLEQASVSKEPMDQRLKRANMEELDEVRRLIEMKIAEKAAIKRSSKDIVAMKKHLQERKETAKAGLVEACIDADLKFHLAIAEAARNAILVDIYKSATVHLRKWFLHLYPDTRVFIESQHYHEQLLQSIIDQDPKKAWNLVGKIVGHMDK